LQKFIQSLIRISSEIIEDSYDERTDVFDLLDKAESKLYEVTQGNIKRSSETAQSLVLQAKKENRRNSWTRRSKWVALVLISWTS
jgi:replicative DNA helicase